MKMCVQCEKMLPLSMFRQYGRKCEPCRRSKTKTCTKCKRTLPSSMFRSYGRHCRDCRLEYDRRLIAANPDYKRKRYVASQRRHAEKHYGLTGEEYDTVRATRRSCECCGRRGCRLVIDHDHGTRTFRGVLCSNCNTGIGAFGDSAEMLTKALHYLARFERKARRAAPVP